MTESSDLPADSPSAGDSGEQPTVPDEDAPVPDPTLIYRLVPTDNCHAFNGQWEFESRAFDNNGDDNMNMSVALGDTLQALGRTTDDLPQRTFPGDEGRWGVAVIRDAGYLKNEEGQEIRRTPRTEEPPEPAHGDVYGKKNSKRRKRIKKHAAWVRRPSAPAEPGQ